MNAITGAPAFRRAGLLERLFPLAEWLDAQSVRGIEQAQARTRLMCATVAIAGIVIAGRFIDLPHLVVGTAIVYGLYTIGNAIHVYMRPDPSRLRRGSAVLLDNIAPVCIAYFGGAFSAYAGFLFLTTMGWGLRFGRHYLLLSTAIAIVGMAASLATSAYWLEHAMFGVTVVFGLAANAVNASILLGRIPRGNRELAAKMEEVAQIAWQDPLTKLPNRLYFQERLSQMVAATGRGGHQVALLLFDLDGFKQVNDTQGHEAGDRLLKEIAQRVGRRTRQADTFARVGGDEFAILMEILHDKSDTIPVAEAVIGAVGEIDTYADRGLRLGASVGIASSDLVSSRERVADEMIMQADRAMYQAKRAGKARYAFAEKETSRVL